MVKNQGEKEEIIGFFEEPPVNNCAKHCSFGAFVETKIRLTGCLLILYIAFVLYEINGLASFTVLSYVFSILGYFKGLSRVRDLRHRDILIR